MSDSTVTLTLYGEIGFSWWGDGTTASDVATLLAEHPSASTIHVQINSPGGNVFDAVAILAQLQRHPARIVVDVDGVAASAASVIAMAGDEIRINEGGFIMIHEGWCFTQGGAQDHQRTADMLIKLNGAMADVYARRSSMTRDDLLAAMRAETWYGAQEAVAAGLADRVVPDQEVVACAGLSRFRRVPARLAATMKASDRRPPTIPDQLLQLFATFTDQETDDMELSVLVSALGLPADTDESGALQHITVLRSEHSELSARTDKLAADLAARDGQVAALEGDLARLQAANATAELDRKLTALSADARITDAQADIIREMFAAGHADAAMKLAASFEQAPQAVPIGPRQSLKSDAVGNNVKPQARTSTGEIDWQALVEEVPAHVRKVAGQTLSANPRLFIETNKHAPWAKALDIDWTSVPAKKE